MIKREREQHFGEGGSVKFTFPIIIRKLDKIYILLYGLQI